MRLPASLKTGFLKQSHFEYEARRIVDVVLMGRSRLWAALNEKSELLNADFGLTSGDVETGMRLAELEGVIAEEHGYEAESEAAVILEGLGIDTTQHEDAMSSLSGGYKLRVLLAQCLFSRPGLLLLDEPTNHLDIVSIAWLETYLKDYPGTVAVVSHDHHFLNTVATHILDIDYEAVRLYPGSYDQAFEAKALDRKQQEQLISRQEKKKEELTAFYNRFRAQATKARQAVSRKKQLERMDDIVIKRSSRIAPRFAFSQKRPSGRQVLDLRELSKGFGSKPVIEGLTVNVMRGERVAVIGPNGAGKTTLIKLICDELSADGGEINLGHEASIGYFAQNHKEQIERSTTPYKWLLNHSSGEIESRIRSTLGAMLFSGDDASKKSEALSGGEAARLVFARLMLAKNNLLLLDEPTNHLDIESIEALAGALTTFAGTVVFVSHDRFFVEKVATSVLEVRPGGYEYYKGGYAEFLASRDVDHLKRDVGMRGAGAKRRKKKKREGADGRTLTKELAKLNAKAEKLEDEIKTLEEGREALNQKLATGELYRQGREEELNVCLGELKAAESKLEARLTEWEAALKRVEEINEEIAG